LVLGSFCHGTPIFSNFKTSIMNKAVNPHGSLRQDIPAAYTINKVPYHYQVTDYGCGDASTQMVLQYLGTYVDQLTLTNVLRTSWWEGTLSTDIVRGGHFSIMSSAVGSQFENISVPSGYPGYPLGYAGYWKDDTQDWLETIKILISSNIPVIVLMHFEPNGTNDGHYRVVVGYNDNNNTIIMNDPWDRGYPTIAHWSYSDFLEAWNYVEPDSPRINPFFGACIMPWIIETSSSSIKSQAIVKASFIYPCLTGFDCTMYPTTNVVVAIELDSFNMFIQSGPLNYFFPLVNSGDPAQQVSWNIVCNGNCNGMTYTVKVRAIVQYTEAATYCCNTTSGEEINYASYTYVDMIGGSVSAEILA